MWMSYETAGCAAAKAYAEGATVDCSHTFSYGRLNPSISPWGLFSSRVDVSGFAFLLDADTPSAWDLLPKTIASNLRDIKISLSAPPEALTLTAPPGLYASG